MELEVELEAWLSGLDTDHHPDVSWSVLRPRSSSRDHGPFS